MTLSKLILLMIIRLLVCGSVLLPSSLCASTLIRFQALGVEDGLLNPTIRAIFQDDTGFMWFGTELGLARFDGYELKLYETIRSDDQSLSENDLTAILAANDRGFWVGTQESGLNLFNSQDQTFTRFQHDPNNALSLRSNKVTALARQSDEFIWVGTDDGLNKFNVTTQAFSKVEYTKKGDSSLKNNIKTLLYSENGTLWVGTEQGLFQFNTTSQDSRFIPLPLTQQPVIRALAQDSKGQIWIGSVKGLFVLNPQTGEITPYNAALDQATHPQTLAKLIESQRDRRIYSLLLKADGSAWIGSNIGLYHIKADQTIDFYQPDKGARATLNDDGIISLGEDHSGNIWVGTYAGGVHWFDPRTLQLGAKDNSLNSLSCLPSALLSSALVGPLGQLYLGTNEGLSLVDVNAKTCINYTGKTKPEDTSIPRSVFALFRDNQEHVWVGTDRGLSRFDELQGTFTPFELDVESDARRLPKSALLITASLSGQLVVGSTQGVYISNTNKTQFALITPKDSKLSKARIYSMKRDERGRIWVGSDQGLLVIDKDLKKMTVAYQDLDPDFITRVRSMFPDKDGHILFTIDQQGFFNYDPSIDSLIQINAKESDIQAGTWLDIGLTDGFAGFTEDASGNLWLATINQGLFYINLSERSIASAQLTRHFLAEDGLQGNLFDYHTGTRLANGLLFFGGNKGLNLFDPKNITANQTPPKLVAKSLSITTDKKDSSGQIMTRRISDFSRPFELAHSDISQQFDFVALHYTASDKIQYQYQLLQGFNNQQTSSQWQSLGDRRSLMFERLSVGDYQLKLRAQSPNGVLSDELLLAQFSKLPPWYLTIWAYLAYTLLLISTLGIFFMLRVRHLKLRAQLLEATVHERTQDLKQSNAQLGERTHELETSNKSLELRTVELAQEKSKVEQLLTQAYEEFAHLNHEFKTPISLILASVSLTLKNGFDVTKLDSIKHNAYRLLRLANQLMQIETIKHHQFKDKVIQPTHLVLRFLAQAFADLAQNSEKILVIGDIHPVSFLLTQDALERIVLNLLSNALKYTKPCDQVFISSIRTADNHLCITVKDTGIGIAKDQLDSVFNRGIRVTNEQIPGAGIGLFLVKRLVDAHQGYIELESTLGEGTEINVFLPIIGEIKSATSEKNQYSNGSDLITEEIMSLIEQPKAEYKRQQSQLLIMDEGFKETILVVEDNIQLQTFIVEILSEDYYCITANDGEEGFAKACAEIPSIIISDVMMPKVDGYELASKLRADPMTQHTPIVFLTALSDRKSRLKGWRRNIDEYLTKPFDIEELLVRIRNILDIRSILPERAAPTGDEACSGNEAKAQHPFMAQLDAWLNDHCYDKDLKVADIAQGLGLANAQQLAQRIKTLGENTMTTRRYLLNIRLKKAAELLECGERPTDVCDMSGFNDPAYFSRCFHAKYGMTPTEYRQKYNSR